MATLDDKILGEKLHYYCSSSESEGEDESNDEGEAETKCEGATAGTQLHYTPIQTNERDGTSSNTGPKGVLKDWQRYKQLETEKRDIQEMERMQLLKKLSLTCRTAAEDEAEKKASEEDPELEELLDDDILRQYMQHRMQEMIQRSETQPIFGHLIDLSSGTEFLEAIDSEHKSVTVVIHVYEDKAPGCEAMNGCLQCISAEYPRVKFCKIKASAAGLSLKFKISGVPALLIYKAGQIIGNFVRLTDELGDDFYAVDVENYLIEHGMLPDKTCVPRIVRGPAVEASGGDDVSIEER